MAVTTLVLENETGREARHARLLDALREHFNNPDLDVEYTIKGKPVLLGINKHISVTTTENLMICAIADAPIGIDGEHVARFTGESRVDYPGIAERFFTEEEAEYVRGGDNPGMRFAKVWVRKEAYSKYTGKGLVDFPNFSVNDGERFYGKVNGVPIKRFAVPFPRSGEFLFAIAGDYVG